MARATWGGLLVGAAALVVARRWGGQWGATDAEVAQTWPGDDIVPQPTLATTHAITVDAPPREVWPWVVQLGYYRGGWHTDADWWDYLADRYLRLLVRQDVARTGQGHREEPTARQIVPEYQTLKVGDVILDGPPGTAYFTVAALEPERVLALYSDTHPRYLFPPSVRDNPRWGIGGEFSWVFILHPTPDGRTRLLLRTRGDAQPQLYRLFLAALLPLADGVMARKMLRGMKKQVEDANNR